MVNNFIRYLRLYWHLIKISAMLETEYRLSFVLEIIVEIAFFVATIVSFSVIFSNISDLAGWSRYQIMVLYGLNMAFSEIVLGVAFIYNLRQLPYKIIKGELDIILTKPVSSLFAATLWRPYFACIPSMLVGLLVAIVGLSRGNINLTIPSILLFSILMLNGCMIAYSVGTIISCLSFWFLNAEPLPFLAQQFIFLAKQPYDIYHGVWRFIFLIIIPTGFMLSFPVKVLMGQFVWWWPILSSGLAVIFLILTNIIWSQGLKTYESASV